MRRLFWWHLSVLLLLAGMPAGAQVSPSSQSSQPSGDSSEAGRTNAGVNEAPPTPAVIKPGVEITGKAVHAERPLPKLPPDEFTSCAREAGREADITNPRAFILQETMCEHQLEWERHIVIEACRDGSGNTPPPRVIAACTESLDRHILLDDDRFLGFANRAGAYFADGDRRHALDDYDAAIKLAPRNAILYYDRGVVFAAQSDDAAALRDLDTAIGIDSKLVPALLQRAKIYEAKGNLDGALTDYSQAIRLQPKTAFLWSERGYLGVRQHDYESAIRDEARAIQLDPKLARAYFLAGVAFADLGNHANAVSDIRTAVDLDPSLVRYVTIKGKTASLALPPL